MPPKRWAPKLGRSSFFQTQESGVHSRSPVWVRGVTPGLEDLGQLSNQGGLIWLPGGCEAVCGESPFKRLPGSERGRRSVGASDMNRGVRLEAKGHRFSEPASIPPGPCDSDVGCNTPGSLTACAQDPPGPKTNVRSRNSRRMLPISRSTKACERGVPGIVLISSTSSTRRFASQR